MEPFDAEDLGERLEHLATHGSGPISFLVGAGLSYPVIPLANEVVEIIRTSVPSVRLDERLSRATNPYQDAFRFVLGVRGAPEANRIVREVVLRAYTCDTPAELDDASLRICEGALDCWTIPPGALALAHAVGRLTPERRGPILTTNFDPLIEVALRSTGQLPFSVVLDSDGHLPMTTTFGAVPVFHLHGYWSHGDTLHTVEQLESRRSQLEYDLGRLLRGSTLVVLGYRGWPDAFMRALSEVARYGVNDLNVIWAAHEPFQEFHDKCSHLVEAFGPAIGRVSLYAGIDSSDALSRLAAVSETARPGSSPEPAPLLSYLTAIADRASQVPAYFPSGIQPIDVHQRVRVSPQPVRAAFRYAELDRRRGVWRSTHQDSDPEFVESDSLTTLVEEWTKTFSSHDRIVVLGDPGFGKSWLLRRQAFDLSTTALGVPVELASDALTPILVRLADLAQIEAGTDLVDRILALVASDYHLSPTAQEALRHQIHRGRAVLLLDGLDEVPRDRRQALREELARMQVGGCKIVLTSRFVGYTGSPFEGARAAEVELLGFDTGQSSQFLRTWAAQSGGAPHVVSKWMALPSMRGMARVPLLCSFIALLSGADDGSASGRSVLYERLLLHLIRESWREPTGEVAHEDAAACLDLLQEVAWEAATEGRWHDLLDQPRIGDAVRRASAAGAPIPFGLDADGFVEFLVSRPGVLVRGSPLVTRGDDAGPLFFVHRSIQEFLVARRMSGMLDDSLDLLDRHSILEPDWEEPLTMLAGSVEDASSLIAHVIALAETADPFFDRTVLAGRMAGEARHCDESVVVQCRQRLAPLLFSASQVDRRRAARALSMVSGGLDDLLQSLERQDAEGRTLIAAELMDLAGSDPELVSRLLHDRSPRVRYAAVRSLASLGLEEHLERVRELILEPLLVEPSGTSLSDTAVALRSLGGYGAAGAEVLVGVVDELIEDDEVLSAFMETCQVLARDVVPHLLSAIDTAEEPSASWLWVALAHVGDHRGLRWCDENLSELYLELRQYAVLALYMHRAAGTEASDLSHLDRSERTALARDLRNSGGTRATSTLLELLADRAADVRNEAAVSLILEASPAAVRNLHDAFTDADFIASLSGRVGEALGRSPLFHDLTLRHWDRLPFEVRRAVALSAQTRNAVMITDRALQDHDVSEVVRLSATRAATTENLGRAARSGNAALARAIAERMRELDPLAAAVELRKTQLSIHLDARLASISALAALLPFSVRDLFASLGDEDVTARVAASSALEVAGLAVAVELAGLLEDPDLSADQRRRGLRVLSRVVGMPVIEEAEHAGAVAPIAAIVKAICEDDPITSIALMDEVVTRMFTEVAVTGDMRGVADVYDSSLAFLSQSGAALSPDAKSILSNLTLAALCVGLARDTPQRLWFIDGTVSRSASSTATRARLIARGFGFHRDDTWPLALPTIAVQKDRVGRRALLLHALMSDDLTPYYEIYSKLSGNVSVSEALTLSRVARLISRRQASSAWLSAVERQSGVSRDTLRERGRGFLLDERDHPRARDLLERPGMRLGEPLADLVGYLQVAIAIDLEEVPEIESVLEDALRHTSETSAAFIELAIARCEWRHAGAPVPLVVEDGIAELMRRAEPFAVAIEGKPAWGPDGAFSASST